MIAAYNIDFRGPIFANVIYSLLNVVKATFYTQQQQHSMKVIDI